MKLLHIFKQKTKQKTTTKSTERHKQNDWYNPFIVHSNFQPQTSLDLQNYKSFSLLLVINVSTLKQSDKTERELSPSPTNIDTYIHDAAYEMAKTQKRPVRAYPAASLSSSSRLKTWMRATMSAWTNNIIMVPIRRITLRPA